MGDKSTYPGVRAKSQTSIEIDFRYLNQRCRESLALSPTEKNLQYAAKLREKVLFEILNGTFDYASTFPQSPNLAKLGLSASEMLVSEALEEWYLRKSLTATKSTLQAYRSAIDFHLVPELGDTPVKDLKLQQVKDWRESVMGELSNKTINNTLTPLRQMLVELYEAEKLDANPLARLRNLGNTTPPEADPLTFDEVQILLNTCEPGLERNLWQFAIFSGLRPGEFIALPWSDVNLGQGVVHIRRNLVLGEMKAPKTQLSRRTLHLVENAKAALNSQFGLTGNEEFVWANPKDSTPFTTHKQLFLSWKRLIQRAGIRYRNPYVTRHTFASLMLSAGEKPMWVAAQMGHTNLAMLQRHYGRWMLASATLPGESASLAYKLS